MDASLHAPPVADTPELSAAQRYGLLGAAIAAALLGLTVLDVESTPKDAAHVAERTTECIVASALFVGAAPVRSAR